MRKGAGPSHATIALTNVPQQVNTCYFAIYKCTKYLSHRYQPLANLPNMELPPGIVFITANAPRIVLPPVLALCGIKLLDTLFNVYIPFWLQVPFYVASFPLALACRSMYADLRDRRQAAMNGAILAPRVPTRWPGGLDLLLRSVRNARSGYMGMHNFVRWSDGDDILTITQEKWSNSSVRTTGMRSPSESSGRTGQVHP